jgi:hypothetical protein
MEDDLYNYCITYLSSSYIYSNGITSHNLGTFLKLNFSVSDPTLHDQGHYIEDITQLMSL